jgi:ribosomal subunit interface protein
VSVAINIHARHRRIGPKLREHIHERLARILRSDPQATSVDVEITSERDPEHGNARVDLTLLSHGRTLRAEAAAPDAWHAVDQAAKRMQEQVRRERERRLDRRFVSRRVAR